MHIVHAGFYFDMAPHEWILTGVSVYVVLGLLYKLLQIMGDD